MTERTRAFGRRLLAPAVTVALTLALSAASIAAEDLRLEAEEFESYGSYNIGGVDITTSYCSYASDGLAVDGLDMPGEWFKLKVTFPSGGCFSSRLDYQSAYGETTQLAVRILDYPNVGEELRADYELKGGFGFG